MVHGTAARRTDQDDRLDAGEGAADFFDGIGRPESAAQLNA
jgi:hypothetical protein